MKCKKCGKDMGLTAEQNDFDPECIEVRAECECGYYLFALVEKADFIDDEEDVPEVRI